MTRNRMRMFRVSRPEVSPVLVRTREHMRNVRVPSEGIRIGRCFGLSREQRTRARSSLRGRSGRRCHHTCSVRVTFGGSDPSRYCEVSPFGGVKGSDPFGDCIPCCWEQSAYEIVDEFAVPENLAAIARCFCGAIGERILVFIRPLTCVRHPLVCILQQVIG